MKLDIDAYPHFNGDVGQFQQWKLKILSVAHVQGLEDVFKKLSDLTLPTAGTHEDELW